MPFQISANALAKRVIIPLFLVILEIKFPDGLQNVPHLMAEQGVWSIPVPTVE